MLLPRLVSQFEHLGPSKTFPLRSPVPNETYRGFTLTGWKALIAMAIFAGWYGLRVYMNMQPVSNDERQVIEEFLTNEYAGNSPQDLLRRLHAAKAGEPIESVPVSSLHVDLRSAAARGSYTHVIVKVEITVEGSTPPDGRAVRYLSLSRQAGKWVVLWNSDSYQYSRALWAGV